MAAVFARAEALRGATLAAAPPSTIDRIRQHAAEHRAGIINLDAVEPPSLTGRQLDRTPGFFMRIGDRRHILLRSACMRRLFGTGMRRAVQELDAQGFLTHNDKLQLQPRVRQEAVHDRVYAVAIEELWKG